MKKVGIECTISKWKHKCIDLPIYLVTLKLYGWLVKEVQIIYWPFMAIYINYHSFSGWAEKHSR